jgi:hypothetical protein
MKGKGREPIAFPVVHSMMEKAKMKRDLTTNDAKNRAVWPSFPSGKRLSSQPLMKAITVDATWP